LATNRTNSIFEPNLKFDSLTPFKNIHKGKRAIVCGSAPSLNDIDFNLINHDKNIIFACNQSVTHLSKCDYFCMTDCTVPKQAFFEYGIKIASKVIISFTQEWYHHHFFKDKDSTLKLNQFYDDLKDKIYSFERKTNPRFDFSCNERLIWGVDVVHPISHLAHITGCTEIVLAGVDLNIKKETYCKSSEHEHPVEWAFSKPSSSQSLNRSFNGWKEIKKQNPNITFLNASPDGKLKELFETISTNLLYT